MPDAEFEARLDAVIREHVPGCDGLIAAERLSGGASQETYRVTARAGGGERRLALRRAPGGEAPFTATDTAGLPGEALLMRTARAAGVPEPEVYYVLEERDGLGDGFLMEWLDGETLGARIVRSPVLDAIRPKLAHECGVSWHEYTGSTWPPRASTTCSPHIHRRKSSNCSGTGTDRSIRRNP